MSILKYKYKAHKFINYAFYIVVFIFGFLLGFSTEKIDFNKLISQLLMIDNVEAYELKYDDFAIDDLEEWIINHIPTEDSWSDFSLDDYNNIVVRFRYLNGIPGFSVYFFNDENLPILEITDEYITIYFGSNTPAYGFDIYTDGSYFSYGGFAIGGGNLLHHYFISSEPGFFTNFDFTKFDNTSTSHTNEEISNKLNVLDFSKFGLDYKLNDGSIFEDENHQDFKKVCWENFSELVFSITIDDTYDGSFDIYQEGQQEAEKYIKSGFYVFDNIFKLKRGTRMRRVLQNDKYDASTWLSGLTFNHLYNITNEFELLHTEENLYSRYSSAIDALGNYDINRQDSYYYDNLHKLKNASYVDFTYYYNPINDYSYDIFHLQEQKENFCIYIPNIFVVTTLEFNELGGFVGDIPIHNDSNESFIDITETTGQLHFNQLFSIINKFINSIKDTVVFINESIYSFFISLHPLIQMFIFTAITLLFVQLIIGMVVR